MPTKLQRLIIDFWPATMLAVVILGPWILGTYLSKKITLPRGVKAIALR